MTNSEEKEKWDSYYESLSPIFEQTDHEIRFDLAFSKCVLNFLPDGGKTLEAGSGAGKQSLALARTGKFEVTLLDFSKQALKHAEALFRQENIPLTTIEADANLPGEPEYDLVFNAGVLEHYTFEEQVRFVRNMASRSRRFVLVMVPNQLCYWYWIWRIQTTSQEKWGFGTEIPFINLAPIFESAGLHFIGHSFLGEEWSESFILSLEGISEELRMVLLDIHRQAPVPLAQKSYLLAGLGCIPSEIPQTPTGWDRTPLHDHQLDPDNYTQLAEATAKIAQLHLIRKQQEQEFQQQVDLLENQALQKSQTISLLESQLNEIISSRGWRMILFLWRARLFLIPHHSLRERALQKTKAGIYALFAICSRIFKPTTRLLPASRNKKFRFIKRQSWYAYQFDRYKRLRLKNFPAHFKSFHSPHQSGLVSIILPVHNGEKYLGEALESILQQTHTNIEVIAINDGSTDETATILNSYADRDHRIRVIHQENQRLPASLSRGSHLAQGEYITWISDDNRLKPTFLEKMVAELQQNPEWDMVYANKDIIGEDGQPLSNSDWYKYYQHPPGSHHVHLPTDVSELNTYPNNYIGGAFLYRGHIPWLLGDYNEFRFTLEDYDYWMQVNSLLQLRHADTSETLYEYRFHGKSLTARDEELGITRNRVKLMIFDDFRRDFYLSPMIWYLHYNNSIENNEVINTTNQLRRKIEQTGQLLFQPNLIEPKQLSRLWSPLIFLSIATSTDEIPLPPSDLPDFAFRALLLIDSDLPATTSDQWDLCLALGKNQHPPRLKKEKQGWLSSPDPDQIFNALDIRARCDHLHAIEQEIFSHVSPKVKASVIICTYQRHVTLANAILSVAQQSIPLSDYEVIIVNNDINDIQISLIIDNLRQEHFSAQPQHLRLIHCPLSGLSHARNAGISEAQSDYLLFLDDDAAASPDWIEKVVEAFENHPQAGVIGGHIHLVPPKPRPEALLQGWEKFWSQFITTYQEFTEVEQWHDFPWGANWCARRQALLEIGGFRTRYGRIKRNFGGGEEVIAASLIKQAGYSIAISPQSVVYHIPVADRYTFEDVSKTIQAGLRVYYQMQRELYIPINYTLYQNIKSILVDIGHLLQAYQNSNRALAIENRYRLQARFKLIGDQITDLILKYRIPISNR